MGCGVSATDWRFVRAPGGGLAGSLQGPSAAAAVLSPIPAETGQRYSKRSRLTVLLWPQAQNYSLTKLRLILAGAMALAIQRFRGSRPVGGRHQLEGSASHPRHRQWEMLMPMANRRIAHPPTGSTARQTGSPRSRLDRDDLNVRAFVLA